MAYVGIANKLRQRIDQHLLKRGNSVATGTSVATLNPDYVTEVEWWTHPIIFNI
jgi:predicted GIY-YIG superfamily endonuclease